MNKTTIEFADYTWNPIVGCKIGCDYCWARKFHKRFFEGNFHEPVFHPERFADKVPGIPKKRNYIAQAISPDKPVVFVCDMGDIFSPGVSWQWQWDVLQYIFDNPQANFVLLTKNPAEIKEFGSNIGSNIFFGTSLDWAHNLVRVEELSRHAPMWVKTFVNVEPILSRMDHVDFRCVDFVIVGALTGGGVTPKRSWHESISHDKIFYKRNMVKYFPDLKDKTDLK